MKNLSLIALFLFYAGLGQAQNEIPRLTFYADGGVSMPLSASYALDSYALPGIRFNSGVDFNFKNGLTLGWSYAIALHSYDVTLAVNDRLNGNSLYFSLSPLTAEVEATSWQHSSFLINLGYKRNLKGNLGIDGKVGFGINFFETPEVIYRVRFNDPSGLNQTQIGASEPTMSNATILNLEAGLTYNFSSAWGIRLGLGYTMATLDYKFDSFISEYDDEEVFIVLNKTVNESVDASWLNASLGLTYSFGKRAQE